VQTWLAAAPEQTKLRQPDPCPPERRRSGLRRWEPRRPGTALTWRAPTWRAPTWRHPECNSGPVGYRLWHQRDEARPSADDQTMPNGHQTAVRLTCRGKSKTFDPSLAVIGARSAISPGKSA
jgi:hypothetical protein